MGTITILRAAPIKSLFEQSSESARGLRIRIQETRVRGGGEGAFINDMPLPSTILDFFLAVNKLET